jgi:hypothetical protein
VRDGVAALPEIAWNMRVVGESDSAQGLSGSTRDKKLRRLAGHVVPRPRRKCTQPRS